MLPNWTLTESEFSPDLLHRQETLFSIGNGFIGSRGTFEEGFPNEVPLTLVGGLYDDVPIYNTELVNITNWMDLTFFVDGEPFRLDRGRILYYLRHLNLHSGVLSRNIRWRSPGGATFDLQLERFISLDDPHTLAIYMTITSIDYKGELEIQSRLGGHVNNAGYHHWLLVDQGMLSAKSAYLHTITKSSHIEAATAFHLSVLSRSKVQYEPKNDPWIPGLLARSMIEPGQTIKIEKLVSVFTTLETHSAPVPLRKVVSDHLEESVSSGYTLLKEKTESAWEREWELCNVTIEGDDDADMAVRFNLYQLLISAPRWSENISIGKCGLTGSLHFGHVFWDTEAMCLPFFTLVQPHIARNLLLYRYNTLKGARKKALENGFKGGMYAWESASNGEENTPRWMPSAKNSLELDRIWCGEIQQHISANIAYAVFFYWQWTQDHEFLRDYGAEILLETARFWGSRIEWNPARSVYEITNVIGPDEYHLHVNNNAFTNWLARWNLQKALWVVSWLRHTAPEMAENLFLKLDINAESLSAWQDMANRLVFPQDEQTGLVEQYEGFFECEDIRLEDYEPRYQSMQNILGTQRTQQYQVLRQPDVLMLFYLMEEEIPKRILEVNWDYYAKRTDIKFGSSIGRSVHARLAARLGKKAEAYTHFMEAAFTDLHDSTENTSGGFHIANAGGVWQSVIFGFAGLALNANGHTTLNVLPQTWGRLSFTFSRQGQPFHITINNPHTANNKQSVVSLPPVIKNEVDLDLSNEFLLKKQRAYNVLVRNLSGMSYRGKNTPNRSMEAVNESCYSITGFFPSEIIRDRKVAYGSLIHPADREYVWGDIQAALAAEQPFWLIYRLITASGEEKWVWEQGQGIRNGESPIFDLEGVIINLSDGQKGSQTLLNIAERLEILHTIDRTILEARIPREVAQIALRHLQRLVPYDAACLVLLKDYSGNAIAYLGDGDQFQLSPQNSTFISQHSDWLMRNRQGRLLKDNLDWNNWFKNILNNTLKIGVNSLIVVPLVSPNDILGLLVMCTCEPKSLSSIHVDIAYEVVSSLTINVRQNRLFQAVSESNKRSQILSQQLVRVQEDERRKLAHELHDEIGQSLTVIKMSLSTLKKYPPTHEDNRLEECIRIVEGTLQQVRSMSLDLRPTMLDDLGLVATLRWFLDRTAQWSEMKTHLNVEMKDVRYAEMVETTCFRIVQESVSNVIRHASAKNIWVKIQQSIHEPGLMLTIQDDGCGYDVQSAIEKASRGLSLGLLGMQERVLLSGGEMEIRSVQGQGTFIKVYFPNPERQEKKEVG